MSEIKHTPGPWTVGYRSMDVGCENDKLGGYAKLFDVRGWGYLTGNGHGGLALDHETAYEIQKANARLIAAAPELLEALKEALQTLQTASRQLSEDHKMVLSGRAWGWRTIAKIEGAIAKAEGRT